MADADVALDGEGEEHQDADSEAPVAQEEFQMGMVKGQAGVVPMARVAVFEDTPGEGQGEDDGQ